MTPVSGTGERPNASRDHGGGLDDAVALFGGCREDWLDLSTGINPVPYPVSKLPDDVWTALPDRAAVDALIAAARAIWSVPDSAEVLPAPGLSSLIARLPHLLSPTSVQIPGPTYNEHAAAFQNAGWEVTDADADAQVLVHPNNPTGRWWSTQDLEAGLRIIDESFCDVRPDRSLVAEAAKPDTLILKSFGKFWGLAGLRLGFAIGDPKLIDQMREALGPWPVSGPALEIGAKALADTAWAQETRIRLSEDAARLDALMLTAGARSVGGTALFRLFEVADAPAWQERFAAGRVWTRVFPYSCTWLRLGLPAPDRWDQFQAAL